MTVPTTFVSMDRNQVWNGPGALNVGPGSRLDDARSFGARSIRLASFARLILRSRLLISHLIGQNSPLLFRAEPGINDHLLLFLFSDLVRDLLKQIRIVSIREELSECHDDLIGIVHKVFAATMVV